VTACRCGEVIKGKLEPNNCLLFDKICTPENPIGPCMVSSEGSCAAYYKYQRV
jgi:hydrogenase expression/formation protein HypD